MISKCSTCSLGNTKVVGNDKIIVKKVKEDIVKFTIVFLAEVRSKGRKKEKFKEFYNW